MKYSIVTAIQNFKYVTICDISILHHKEMEYDCIPLSQIEQIEK